MPTTPLAEAATTLRCADGSPASRLGLAGHADTDPRCVAAAHEAGVNLFFFYNLGFTGIVEGLAALGRRPDALLATGSESRDPDELETYLDQVCRRLDTDIVDVLFAEYVNPDDDLDQLLGDDGVIGRLQRLKAAGRVRYAGATVHSRPLAGQLLESGRIDVLMHRYNMAHRGPEEQVLPAAVARGVPVVAFTCTRWGSLLSGHSRWRGPVPSAADCYRFALHHAAVDVALTAPASLPHLRENLEALRRPVVTDEELRVWREYGALVYGQGADSFETEWP